MVASRLQNNIRPGGTIRMARIAIIDRADMNAEQARVYDAAKVPAGPWAGRLCLYPTAETVRGINAMRASLADGPLSRREQQIVNLPSPGTGVRAIRGSPRRAPRSPSALRRT